MKIRCPETVATSMHSPFPALKLALRQERLASPKTVIGMLFAFYHYMIAWGECAVFLWNNSMRMHSHENINFTA
jgi:hypothetical protein